MRSHYPKKEETFRKLKEQEEEKEREDEENPEEENLFEEEDLGTNEMDSTKMKYSSTIPFNGF
jgi:hypothetical protein